MLLYFSVYRVEWMNLLYLGLSWSDVKGYENMGHLSFSTDKSPHGVWFFFAALWLKIIKKTHIRGYQ